MTAKARPTSIDVDPFSTAVLALEILGLAGRMGHATGFVWEVDERRYLVTNWHVVSGRHFQTGKCLDKVHAALPNRIGLIVRGEPESTDAGFMARMRMQNVNLRDDADQPIWLIHPEKGHAVDVAALPLPEDIGAPPLNSLPHKSLDVGIGMDVFVLGYPFEPDAFRYPIWKRGSIATEIELWNWGFHDYLLVDIATKKGMSGSPVLRRSWGMHSMDNGTVHGTPGAWSRMIGIYSGRITSAHALEAQLGIVWGTALVDDICRRGIRDTGEVYPTHIEKEDGSILPVEPMRSSRQTPLE